MADNLRQVITEATVKKLLRTAPMLKEFNSSAIQRFVNAYDTFMKNLRRQDETAEIDVQTFIKAEVLYELETYYNLTAAQPHLINAKAQTNS